MHNIKAQQMQQPHRKSPRPKPKQQQILATSTPVKRAVEYAGPSFNHSPAPSSLPPPPFLVKSAPRRDPAALFALASPEPEPSPLSFLFTAKDKEDALKKLQVDRPPPLAYAPVTQAVPETSLANATQPELQRRASALLWDPQEHASLKSQMRLENTAQQYPSPSTFFDSSLKRSPWATVDKPKAINLNDNIAQAKDTRPPAPVRSDKDAAPKPPPSKKAAAPNLSDRKIIKPKKSNGELLRKKRNSREGPAPSVQPIQILKRQQADHSPEPSAKAPVETKVQPQRETSANTFKPLRRRSPSNRDAHSSAATLKESEEELRQQAVNLMAILQIHSPADARSPAPSRERFVPETRDYNPSRIESDLRRMLQLGA